MIRYRVMAAGCSLALLLALTAVPVAVLAGDNAESKESAENAQSAESVDKTPSAVAEAADNAPATEEVPATPAAATGQVYKTVDAKGNVHFTDSPPADGNAQQVKMPTVNSMPPASLGREGGDGSNDKKGAAGAYIRLAVTAPASDAVLGQDVASVDVRVQVEPGLQEGHVLRILFDGKPVAEGDSCTVNDLQRGTHTLEARIYDGKGKVVKASPRVQFHVRRISALNKVSANGKNQTKPKPGLFGRLFGRSQGDTVADAQSTGGFHGAGGNKASGGFGSLGGAGSLKGADSIGNDPTSR